MVGSSVSDTFLSFWKWNFLIRDEFEDFTFCLPLTATRILCVMLLGASSTTFCGGVTLSHHVLMLHTWRKHLQDVGIRVSQL